MWSHVASRAVPHLTLLLRLQVVKEAVLHMMKTEFNATLVSANDGDLMVKNVAAADMTRRQFESISRLSSITILAVDNLRCSLVDIRRPSEPLLEGDDDRFCNPPAATDIDQGIVYLRKGISRRTTDERMAVDKGEKEACSHRMCWLHCPARPGPQPTAMKS